MSRKKTQPAAKAIAAAAIAIGGLASPEAAVAPPTPTGESLPANPGTQQQEQQRVALPESTAAERMAPWRRTRNFGPMRAADLAAVGVNGSYGVPWASFLAAGDPHRPSKKANRWHASLDAKHKRQRRHKVG